jgi:SPP1 family predicted phage head-tail adaptor
MISSSELSERITLLRPVYTQDSAGDTQTTWVDEGEIWAQILDRPQQEGLLYGAIRPRRQWHIRIRHRSDISADWRVRFEGEDLSIISLENDPRTGAKIKLIVEKNR